LYNFTVIFLQHTSLHEKEFEVNESGIVVLMPYISYVIAVAFDLSGIIAILFCGIAMARYDNLAKILLILRFAKHCSNTVSSSHTATPSLSQRS
jgi:NhaP-type Na+/H+ or K+/H+ antiporter